MIDFHSLILSKKVIKVNWNITLLGAKVKDENNLCYEYHGKDTRTRYLGFRFVSSKRDG